MSDPQVPDAPTIDTRTAADIVALLAGTLEGTAHKPGLLSVYTTPPPPDGSPRPYPFEKWQEVDLATGAPLGRSAALIRIFARFAEILIERLNRVPEKNLLAFLDLLGAERLPPQPARVPLTFTLAAGSAIDAEVPAGTRVAAPPPPGAKDPVEFETEQTLTVTATRLDALLTLDPSLDQYGDWGLGEAAFPLFTGNKQIEHILYIGDSQLFAYPQIHALCIAGEAAAGNTPGQTVKWEYWNGEYLEDGQKKWEKMTTSDGDDGTEGLSKTGTIHFPQIPILPQSDVNGSSNRWLRCILVKSISPEQTQELPRIKKLTSAVLLKREPQDGLVPDLGFSNGAPLDVSKEFYPFGERPRLYDTFYLASEEAFARNPITSKSASSVCFPGVEAHVAIQITLANGNLASGAIGVRPSFDLELAWECWNGTLWKEVGKSVAPDWLALIELDPLPILHSEDDKRVLIQGNAQSSVGLITITRVHAPADGHETEAPVHYPVIDRFGRFADSWEITKGLNKGLNIIEVEAEYKERWQKAWIVVLVDETEAISFSFQSSKLEAILPEAKKGISLQLQWLEVESMAGQGVGIKVSEEDFTVIITYSKASTVKAVRVSNGRLVNKDGTTNNWPAARDEGRILISVEPGRNDLLIEALDGGNPPQPLAATTAVIDVNAPPAQPNKEGFADGTYGLTQSGLVSLRLPETTSRTAVNGQESHWLRVRILKGNYGKEASYVLKDPTNPEEGFLLVPESFRPPIVREVRLGYELIHERSPEVCLTYNQLAYTNHTKEAGDENKTFAPFVGIAEDRPALYLGLSLPAGKTTFPATALSFYARLDDPLYDEGPTGGPQIASSGLAQVGWEYWNGTTWARLRVQDGTDTFTRSGLLTLLPPADFASSALFGRHHWWLRASLGAGQDTPKPRLAWLRLNTTSALQVVSITNEILGSSNGTADQSFRGARTPVLAGQQLEVREPEVPGVEDLSVLLKEEGADVTSMAAVAAGRPREVWVRWHEVPDLYGSGPTDRHYTINHLTGEVRFGDGVNGRIPPPGSSNLRLARYRTGGGSSGNCAVGTVVQLKTTVPYVDKVSNPEAATGGAEAETIEAMVSRTPRTLRHQDRAVTPEDYEDLARLASTDVARARCVPLRKLDTYPLGKDEVPGAVSVIVVPRSEGPKPQPTLELLERVRAYLLDRTDATASLAVVGPRYLEVTVIADIAVDSPASAGTVERAVRSRLDAFLHPLTGGLDQQGWDFGRAPHRSDFYTLIEQVPGVDYCRSLELREPDNSAEVRASRRFLVYAGKHKITLAFPQA